MNSDLGGLGYLISKEVSVTVKCQTDEHKKLYVSHICLLK